MKIDMKKYGCKDCKMRNGNVCDICYKSTFKEFFERNDADAEKSIKTQEDKNT